MKDLIVKINTEQADLGLLDSSGGDRAGRVGSAGGISIAGSLEEDEDDLALLQPSSERGGQDVSTDSSSSGSFWPDLEVLDPDHPILERFQANLSQILEEEDQQLTLKIIELEEKRKCVLRERKKLSVGLEDLKRSSEKSQATLKKEKDSLEVERNHRQGVEARLPDKKLRVDNIHSELDAARVIDHQLQKQVDSVRNKLFEMKKKLEQQQEQLELARNQLELGTRQRDSSQSYKLFQDVMINQLLAEVDGFEWRRNQAEASLLEEEQLTAGLRDAIRNAHTEVATINAEKIRLNQSWQSSLLALQRDHDQLASIRQSIKNEESRRDEMLRCWRAAEKESAEISSKRAGIQLELGRLERKMANQETQYQEREAEKSLQAQRNRNIQTLLRLRQEEYESITKELEHLLKSETDALEKVQAQCNKRKKLEADILDQVYRNFACDQEGQAIYKHIRETEEASRELDLLIAGAESRNGRLMLEQDQLEREGRVHTKLLDEQETAVKEKDSQLKRLEKELAEQHKLLERKEAVLLRYKTSLDELRLMLQEGDGHRTEEERIIKGLQEQLDECRRSTESTQRRWSETEQNLISVAMARDYQAVQEEKLREETNVWETKKKRLLRQVEEIKASQAQCHRSIHGWREHLQQLDGRLAKTMANKENLERWNQLCQQQWHLQLENQLLVGIDAISNRIQDLHFVQSKSELFEIYLKYVTQQSSFSSSQRRRGAVRVQGFERINEPEREVHRMREEAERIRNQQSSLEITLCDLSKVAMLWQCKLADIREAQNYVQAERSDAGALAILQTEKHRLQVQEIQLKKEQEILNHQLQKTVLGRSALNVKADLKVGLGHRTRVVQHPVDENSWHKILSKEIARRQKEAQSLEKAIGRDKARMAELIAEKNELQLSIDEDKKRFDTLNRQISELSSAKKIAVAQLASQQKWWRFWDAIKRGAYQRKYGADTNLQEVETRIRQRTTDLASLADRMAKEYPHLSFQFKDIRNSLQSNL